MSQITTFLQPSGPGSGTVTSVTGGTGINITGVPTVNPTVNLDVPVVIANGGTNAITFANTFGVVYFDGTRLVDTTVGTAGFTLTSNGVGLAPTFQATPASIPTSFNTDSGTATPALNVLDIVGAHGINTSGATNVVTVAINNAITLGDLTLLTAGNNALTVTSGDIVLSGTGVNAAANIELPDTNSTGGQGVILMGGSRFAHNYGGGVGESVYIGNFAGNFTTTAGGNTALGYQALELVTTGSNNVAIGDAALWQQPTGDNNVAVGSGAMTEGDIFGSGSGDQNVAIGANALHQFGDADNNVAVGYQAGFFLRTGGNNILLGKDAGLAYTSNEASNIIIGVGLGTISDDNKIRIGTTGAGAGQQNECYIAGIANIATSNSEMVTIDTTTGQLGSDTIPTGFATTYNTDSGSASPAAGTLTVTGGLNIDTSGAASTVTIAASPDQYLTSYSVANASPYVVTATDFYITVDTSTIPITIQLPDAPTIYRRFVVKDSAGNAAAQNVTVTTVSGIKFIDSATTFLMNTDWQAAEFVYDNFGYQIF